MKKSMESALPARRGCTILHVLTPYKSEEYAIYRILGEATGGEGTLDGEHRKVGHRVVDVVMNSETEGAHAGHSPARLPESFNFARHLLQLNASRESKAAYLDDEEALTFGDLWLRVKRVADALLALGLRREERVILLAPDGNHWPVSFLGALYAGIVPVPINPLMTVQDLAFFFNTAERARRSWRTLCWQASIRPDPWSTTLSAKMSWSSVRQANSARTNTHSPNC